MLHGGMNLCYVYISLKAERVATCCRVALPPAAVLAANYKAALRYIAYNSSFFLSGAGPYVMEHDVLWPHQTWCMA